MSKMLNAENLLAESGIDPGDTTVTADKLLYHHAIEQCQSAALDELFNNPTECVQRYQAAHVLLHALQFQTGSQVRHRPGICPTLSLPIYPFSCHFRKTRTP